MTKPFARFARKARLAGESLVRAAEEVVNGEFDADLGGHVYKQRIARSDEGKSGGFRTIILFEAGGHSFFVHGFGKKDKANVSAGELKTLKLLAKRHLSLSADEVRAAIDTGALIEVMKDGREDKE